MIRIPHRLVGALLLLGVAVASPARAGFLNGVCSPDGIDVWAVGDTGMVYRSADAGAAFVKSYQGSTPLRAVASRGGTVLIVGDGGKVIRSADNGITWTTATVAGGAALYDVDLPAPAVAWAVGAGGTVLRSTDGGATWSPRPTGVATAIRAARFLDASNGWIVGDAGVIRRTSDGGASWSPVALATPNALYAIDQLGSRVWAAGAGGACWKSADGGATWAAVNLKMDSRSDVRSVCLQGADSVFVAGGGGFIRRSVDDGATWTFPVHPLMGEISSMVFVGAHGWVSSVRSPAVMRTLDRGIIWAFATGTTTTRSWSLRQPIVAGSQRGSTVALNPVHRSTLYAGVGSILYVSRNDGDAWTPFSTVPGSKVNALVVSPRDSLRMVVAASAPHQLLYTENGGATWNLAANGARIFGEYGIPIEMHPDRPDTLLFGGDASAIWRSTDFGKSWEPFGTTVFRSPCDLIVVPESDSAVVLLGDGTTGIGAGEIWRSTDGGASFTHRYTVTGSEIPGMAMGRLDHRRAFATSWTTGGLAESGDAGLEWTPTETTSSAWGIDVCDEDPNLVVYGVLAGGLSYLSLDGGATFTTTPLSGSNYSFYARDRSCILAEQAAGLHKLVTTYVYRPAMTQSVAVTAPAAGASWDAGGVHDITWNSANVSVARIEWRRFANDAWQRIADVPGYHGRYAWTCPELPLTNAEVRVSDAIDGTPSHVSGAFTLALPLIAHAPASLDFGTHLKGGTYRDSVRVNNGGTGTLHVTSATTATPFFTASPASFDVPPSGVVWVRIAFEPEAATSYADQLTLLSDGYGNPTVQVPLGGAGEDTSGVELASPNGGEVLPYATAQTVAWFSDQVASVDLDYRVSETDPWVPIASGVAASAGSWTWTIPDAPTTTGRVRVRESSGSRADVSDGDFTIVVPRLAVAVMADLVAPVGSSVCDTLRLANAGTAPLTITAIASDRPTFVPARTSLTLEPGACDTLTVCFTPAGSGRDSATLTIAADGPAAPHAIPLIGIGAATTAVGQGSRAAFELRPNQPNPFAGTTRIEYALERPADVGLEVFDLQGHRVATLVDGAQSAGVHRLEFPARRPDGSRLSSGVYFLRFRAGDFRATRRMLLLR